MFYNISRHNQKMRIILMFCCLMMLLGSFVYTAHAESKSAGPAVVVIPIDDTINASMESFVTRALEDAQEARAEQIIIILNTYGGSVDSASNIGELIRQSSIPVTAYIKNKAVSAGTYLALNANQIVMEPGSTMGAAAVVNGSGKLIEDPKTISYWVAQMQEAASLNGRDAQIAAAMVDVQKTIDLTSSLGRVVPSGEVLSLTASEALQVGYAEHHASSVEETISWLGLSGRTIISIEPTPAEKFANFLIHPVVSTILLIVGIVGLAVELFIPSFGLAGILGILSMGLFFFGSYISGLAGIEASVLFIVGILLLIIEVFAPTMGILGVLGGGALITGIMLASVNWQTGLISLLVAIVIAIIVIAILSKTRPGKSVWNKFVLKENLTTEEGFLPAETKNDLIGQKGTTVTPLRPAGTAIFGNIRLDVVTEGGFIELNKPVIVVKAEGTWVVVREVKDEN